MSLAGKIASNTAVQIAGKVIIAAIGIIITKLLTMYLGVKEYGAYTTVYEFLFFFVIAAKCGIPEVLMREMSKHPTEQDKILGSILGLQLVIATIAVLICSGSVWLIPGYRKTHVPLGVMIGTGATFAMIMTDTISSVTQTHLRMGWAVIARVIGKCITLGCMALVMFSLLPENLALGFYYLIGAGSIGNVIMLFGTIRAAGRLVRIRIRCDLRYWKTVCVAAFPYGAALVLADLYFRIDTLLLSILAGSDAVGYYGIAMRIVENFYIISIFFLNSVFPILSTTITSVHEKFTIVFQRSFDTLIILSAPFVFGGWILASPLVSLISSPDFLSTVGSAGSDIALRLLLVAMSLASISNLFGYTLLAGNEQRGLLVVNAIAVAMNIGLNIAVIPKYGFVGAATASIISQIFVVIALGHLVRRRVNVLPRLKVARKAIIAAVLMAIVVRYGHGAIADMGSRGLLILLPLGGLVYVGGLCILRVITPDMLRMILRSTIKRS